MKMRRSRHVITVDMWADVRCPWCWVGLRRLRRAIAHVGQDVRVRHRSFHPMSRVESGHGRGETNRTAR
ncbi:DsbA family protein [Sphaerimonospora cavernae]|uniref:DsbA family protein n=1 Tax=Sphaerimonospora cavernae TaxID=1740611 RepID=A0ABV6U4A9_9ACTN